VSSREGADYELGAIVDPGNATAETLAEGNNATYTGIWIAPAGPISLFNPLYVIGGQPTTGTLTLAGAAGGTSILLSETPIR
jgi:hypothetical protein